MRAVVEIVDFAPKHLEGVVSALMNVRASDSTYPPQSDAEYTREAFSSWLFEVDPVSRWVATVDGRVAGHVLLIPPYSYLTDFLDSTDYEHGDDVLLEIGKFFVDPAFQGHGIGDLLFRTACARAEYLGKQACLSVVSTSLKAVKFYEHHGMHKVGNFDGFHGVNHVFVQESKVIKPAVGELSSVIQ